MTILLKLLMTGIGALLMLLGLAISPLPGPFGVPVMLLGLIVLLRSSTWVKRHFVRLTQKHPRLMRPVRALLRPGAKVVALLWLSALRLERKFLGRQRRFLYRFRHDLKALISNRRKRHAAQVLTLPGEPA